jgi:transmembrane sensor
MTQREFDQLSEKYLRGECNPKEVKLLEKWYTFQETNSNPAEVFTHEKQALQIEKRLWRKIKQTTLKQRGKILYLPSWLSVGIAACLVLLIGYFFVQTRPFPPTRTADSGSRKGIESINTSNSQQKLVLPDGSTATLGKNASIIVDQHYGRRLRKVFLQGEAFFEVERNAKQPFLVYSGDLVTEVLGTSFSIKPQPQSKTIEVAVRTGRVSVYTNETLPNKKRQGLILSPNQKAVFNIDSKTIQEAIVDVPQVLVPDLPKSDFQFEDTPLANIASTMQHAYGIEIVLLNANIRECKFTGNLNGLGLQKQLDLVCGSFNLAYEIRGTSVFILGDHCE